MSETAQIIGSMVLLIAVFLLSRIFMGWRIRRAGQSIIGDLEQKNALNAASAVELPYARTTLLKFGLRDFRPKALSYMVQMGIVGKTEGGKYYKKMVGG